MKKLQVLALASYPDLSACTRFRVTEYASLLSELGIDFRLSSVLGPEAFAGFYGPGSRLKKGRAILGGTLKQLAAVLARDIDVVFVEREATLVGPAFVEWLAAKGRRLPLVYDLDDSVWESTTEFSRHPLAAWLLKSPGKTWDLMRMADHVIGGSKFLGRVASEHNANVTVLPTVVSRERWIPHANRLRGEFASSSGPPVVGWIGSHTTALTLEVVAPALRRLKASGRQFTLRLIGAADGFRMPGIDAEIRPWRRDREILDFQELDIGIAPLLPMEFSRGKCAFKQLEYMAVGVPSVSSPGGGALDFIEHGVNGLLAKTEDDWVNALGALLDDASLRGRIARAGRALVEATHCTEAQAPRLAEILWSVAKGKAR